MTVKRNLLIGASSLAVAERSLQQDVIAQQKSSKQAPRFEVDPYWPKPLPNHWLLGSTIGVDVDEQDHVWIIHRISIDKKGNVWIGGNGANDGHVLKFTKAGKFIKQFGFMYANAGSTDAW